MLTTGHIFSISDDYLPVPGCTISGELIRGATIFSLAEGTDISAESYPVPVMHYELSGKATLIFKDTQKVSEVRSGQVIIKNAESNIGIKADIDNVYVEIPIRKEDTMNNIIKAGQVFTLKDLVPYKDDKIVNMDLINNDTMKFVVMSFDKGCALSEHAAPRDAVVFALDGEGIIGYEGKEYRIKAGESFYFAKGGLHSVKAQERFKMALLLSL